LPITRKAHYELVVVLLRDA